MKKQNYHVAFFFLLLALIIYAAFRIASPYISLVILAFVTASLFQPVYLKLLDWLAGRTAVATNITLGVFLLAVIIPVLFLINITVVQISAFNQDIANLNDGRTIDENSELIIYQVNQVLAMFPGDKLVIDPENVQQLVADIARPVGSYLLQALVSVGKSTPEVLVKIILFLIFLSTFLSNYQVFIDFLKKLSPLDDELDEKYISRSVAMMKSMLLGTGVIAFAQAVVGGLFLWIAGVPYVLFWILVMTFAGIIPLGAGIVTIPAGIILLSMGYLWQGLFVLLGQIVVVANIDNVLRPRLVSKDAQMSSALLLLGVFGGVQIFGLLGVVYGPVIMIFLKTSIEIYFEHYQPNVKSTS